MDVIFGDMSFDNQHICFSTYLSNNFSQSCANFCSEHWTAILCDKDDVQMPFKYGVCTKFDMLKIQHTLKHLLKSSPEGEGFDPPSRGQ